jgi:hypothetical protein
MNQIRVSIKNKKTFEPIDLSLYTKTKIKYSI